MMFKFKLIVSGVTVVLLVFGWQQYQVSKLNQTIDILTIDKVKLEQAIVTQSRAMAVMKSGYSNALAANKRLTKNIKAIDSLSKQENNKLNNYRGRLNEVALKKPKIVERAANRAMANIMLNITKATDDRVSSNYN